MTDDIKLFLMGDYGERWCRFHSTYKGWEIWREWDLCGGHGRMSYFGVKDGEEPQHAKISTESRTRSRRRYHELQRLPLLQR